MARWCTTIVFPREQKPRPSRLQVVLQLSTRCQRSPRTQRPNRFGLLWMTRFTTLRSGSTCILEDERRWSVWAAGMARPRSTESTPNRTSTSWHGFASEYCLRHPQTDLQSPLPRFKWRTLRSSSTPTAGIPGQWRDLCRPRPRCSHSRVKRTSK